MDSANEIQIDLYDKEYTPGMRFLRKLTDPSCLGYIGLNNAKAHDHVNVIVQALVHVKPIRDYLLLCSENNAQTPEIMKALSVLCKRMWNSRIFKAHVSPHDFVQVCA